MQLPRGITGFRMAREAPLPETDQLLFKTHCYLAAQQIGGWVTRPPATAKVRSGTRNYIHCDVALPGLQSWLPPRALAIVLNLHHPFVAFAGSADVPGRYLQFEDHAELAAALTALDGLQVLTTTILATAPRGLLSQLGPADLLEIKFWKPRRIGDIIFNYWD
jgi:hypothetical protein